jgi:hypothetical protein
MSAGQKKKLLMSKALFLDEQKEGDERVCLYFLQGIFVETIEKSGVVIENLPYKRGFSIRERSLNYKVAA